MLRVSHDGAENPLSPAPFAGIFSNDKLAVQLSESGDGYAGTISMNGRQFPAKATADGQQLSGVFTASGNQFDFTATLAHDQMTLVSGKNTYTLTRAAENPLDQSSPAPEPSPSQPQSPRRRRRVIPTACKHSAASASWAQPLTAKRCSSNYRRQAHWMRRSRKRPTNWAKSATAN